MNKMNMDKQIPLSMDYGCPDTTREYIHTSAMQVTNVYVGSAQLLKQTKIHPYTLSVERLLLTRKGPKKSIPV
jgi:hypothetical protein